jgi:cysteinyl-tRNA synthetase
VSAEEPEVRLYNTLTSRVEDVVPLSPPDLTMYVCGLTVYDRGHIGNYRTLVVTDILRRFMRQQGLRVRQVLNITDVDDRIIQKAQAAGTNLRDFTEAHIRAFHEDFETLRLDPPEFLPRATEHVPDMIDLIGRLIERGHTYQADGSIYFRISSFPEYGRLSRLDVAGIKSGARVDTDKYEKEDARDFVLWKAKSDEPEWAQWDAPFGRGRPGWHIECSAMGMKYLGPTLDLHCGGVDLIFPHHENEIAQSRCGTGRPFVRHWMHVEHLLVNDETMSKSKGNFYTLPDLLARGHRPEAIRYLLSQAHYRKRLNFTFEGLSHAEAALDRLYGLARRLEEVERTGPCGGSVRAACDRARQAFEAALADDLNTPEALAAVHGLVGEGNGLLADGELTREGAACLLGQLRSMNEVFAVLLPKAEERLTNEEQSLLDERERARRERDFGTADVLRARLLELGVVLEDTPKGTRWRRQR